jgi:transcriptional regulator of acetoin/glycerol metabolism
MENATSSDLYPVMEKARRNVGIPPADLPTLGAMIDAYIDLVLDLTSRNVNRTACILDVSRSTLYRYLRKHG